MPEAALELAHLTRRTLLTAATTVEAVPRMREVVSRDRRVAEQTLENMVARLPVTLPRSLMDPMTKTSTQVGLEDITREVALQARGMELTIRETRLTRRKLRTENGTEQTGVERIPGWRSVGGLGRVPLAKREDAGGPREEDGVEGTEPLETAFRDVVTVVSEPLTILP